MATTDRRQPLFWGAALVVIGVVLLVHKLDLLPFSWWVLISGVVAAAALAVIVRKFRTGGNQVFWWILLFGYASITFVRDTGWLDIPPWYGLPLALIVIGLGFAGTIALRPGDWHLAVPAVLFLGLGIAILLSEIGVVDEDSVRSAITAYWPFALILFGAALLLNWRGKRSAAS